MRSLFARILVWFLVTVAVTIAGMSAITGFSFSGDRRPPGGGFTRLLLAESRNAFETGGREALQAYLDRLSGVFRMRGVLTDAAGIDLLTGEDLSALIAARPVRPRRPWLPLFLTGPGPLPGGPGAAAFDGRYRFLMIPPANLPNRWLFLPQQIWALAAAIMLCYALARYLTAPVRSLQKAVERFGKGDLAARAGSGRHDELGELAQTFDHMAERIQALMLAERRLLLDISHEVRSPLARLGVAVELARSGTDAEAALNRIQKEADRLNTLVGELLEITRAEGDPGMMRTTPVRLDELLRETVEDCSIEAHQRGTSLRLEAGVPVTVSGDGELLRRAVENVVRNAIRFAPEATAVEIALLPGPGGPRMTVRDYGPGVPEASLERIFDPFYRVEGDRNRSSGGVGLGLAIARRAVDLHKGELRAKNAQPGLLVELELPATAGV